ncbi:MAG: hypothetical protein ABI539_13465 [Acidobacteriota bacterium]
MKIVFTLLLFVTFTASAFAAVRQDRRIIVQVEKEKSVSGMPLKIKFVKMVEDSRCPKDVNCVWAGNAKITVRVTKNGRTSLLELNSNMGEPPEFDGYRFTLIKLTPEPASNIRINPSGYMATISVQKVKRSY